MTLQRSIYDLLEAEAERRPKASVDELIDAAVQGVDEALVEWVGVTAATLRWRRWVADQCGRASDPLTESRRDSVLAQKGDSAP